MQIQYSNGQLKLISSDRGAPLMHCKVDVCVDVWGRERKGMRGNQGIRERVRQKDKEAQMVKRNEKQPECRDS